VCCGSPAAVPLRPLRSIDELDRAIAAIEALLIERYGDKIYPDTAEGEPATAK
jgi:hypothetical protein